MEEIKDIKQDFWGEPSFKPLLDYWDWKLKMLRKYVDEKANKKWKK